MARPKKDGRRATGIQGKKGYLYIVFSEPVIKNGVRKIEKRWIATGLADTPDNVKKASATRTKMLSKDPDTVFDGNVSLSDFMDHMLARKKREVSDTTYSGYYYRAKRIKEFFGDIRVRDLNKRMVESFLDDLFETHHIQPRTAKDVKVFFGNIMEHAVSDGLRSSCVSILVHQGMDVKSIQKWVGHADIDTTLRIYAKVKDKESKMEISNAMNDIIPLKKYEADQ